MAMKNRLMALRADNTADWPPGPTDYHIVNGDQVQVQYRRLVEDYLANIKDDKELFKKKFVSISTNVLCAVTASTMDERLPNYMRDLYMPVELSFTKWSIGMKEGDYVTRHFMFHPGEPAKNCRNFAKDHLTNHKIEGIQDGPFETPPDQYKNVLTELYQFVQPDMTLFSMSLRHVRQDVGSIKWLIDQVCGPDMNKRRKFKPLKILNIRDLYVVGSRLLGLPADLIGKGVADRRLSDTGDEWDSEFKCLYHNREQNDTNNCTSANCIAKARKISQDMVRLFKPMSDEIKKDEQPGQRLATKEDTLYDLEKDFGNLNTNDNSTPSTSCCK